MPRRSRLYVHLCKYRQNNYLFIQNADFLDDFTAFICSQDWHYPESTAPYGPIKTYCSQKKIESLLFPQNIRRHKHPNIYFILISIYRLMEQSEVFLRESVFFGCENLSIRSSLLHVNSIGQYYYSITGFFGRYGMDARSNSKNIDHGQGPRYSV